MAEINQKIMETIWLNISDMSDEDIENFVSRRYAEDPTKINIFDGTISTVTPEDIKFEIETLIEIRDMCRNNDFMDFAEYLDMEAEDLDLSDEIKTDV